ncbi:MULTISPECIES: DUF1615 domain-containing protein [unclassified Roseateles]|uniref:DUF1615 domain-containing protein n=1 Tax=unclassified Roseateles TaxID=2626991 RepID=UPI000701888C|nr:MULTISPECIES: DUF1615 domain-containing protein [unclassified Roseateles]KQW46284.1 hypothetical protein ASC81_07670 [Pelomonas sp. Root405]KRA73333.1 hypothetical protein ASD88_07670 [Pelomonas sp. Root662]
MRTFVSLLHIRWSALTPVALLALLAGCGSPPPAQQPEGLGPTEARRLVAAALPDKTPGADGWAADIHAALATLALPSTVQNLCAVMAVIEQESGYTADPAVPGLPAIAWKEIERRADEANVPMLMVRAAFALDSPDGRSYAERLNAVKTERQLSEVFEDFIGMVPLGKRFLADNNPVRTGGPMQVSIAFAQAHAQKRRYPYEVKESIRREVFTRRGGIYFGTAHLLAYEAPYDAPIYRFADFNAGRYASRNAGFQNALSVATGLPLALDGDLVSRTAASGVGETGRAALTLANRLRLSEAAVKRDLDQGDEPGFENTELYERVFAYAEQLDGRKLPRAVMPRIDLKSPKFTRKLTTQWFATRVNDRHGRCVKRLAALSGG